MFWLTNANGAEETKSTCEQQRKKLVKETSALTGKEKHFDTKETSQLSRSVPRDMLLLIGRSLTLIANADNTRLKSIAPESH